MLRKCHKYALFTKLYLLCIGDGFPVDLLNARQDLQTDLKSISHPLISSAKHQSIVLKINCISANHRLSIKISLFECGKDGSQLTRTSISSYFVIINIHTI
jgi:hypothetical protein